MSRMPETAEAPQQKCPACGKPVDVAEAEPLARVACPNCGEKFRVERAFDNFVLVETLGVGGMGSVYKARDTRLERFVALKLLRKELSADPAEAARLEQEARVTASINHPNVVQVYSAGSAHGQIYLVMELVDYGSLDDLMAQLTRVPEARVLQAGIQVAKGLQAAHAKGLIHRDVKPANILFSDAQTAKIGDFGLAGAAEQKEARSEIWGTPYYVAPERLNNEPEDFRSDIYSLGATLFHALAGKPPMEGETTSAAELRQLKSHPPDLRAIAPDISRETARVINRMLAPEPANRFTSYAHVVDQLLGAYRALPGVGASSGEGKGRGRWLGAAVAVVLLALIGLGVFFFQKRKPAAPPLAAPLPAPAATADNNAALQPRYNDARRLLIDGKYDQAAGAFTKLAAEAGNRQPFGNWLRLHVGLTALLQKKTGPARDAFQLIERGGPFSNAKNDAELARFFVETSRTLSAAGPVRVAAVSSLNPKSAEAFAFFLFGIKNWQLGEFNEAAGLLEKFSGSEPPNELSWINDYKPVARKFLEDYRVYAEWKQTPQELRNAAEISDALTRLKGLQSKLQMRSAHSDLWKDEEKRLNAEVAKREKSEREAEEQMRAKLLAQESPAWNDAVEAAAKKIAVYDFAGAAATLETVPLTEPSLLKAQTDERKKTQWMVEWKKTLIADLNTGRFRGAIKDIPNVDYQGVISATESTITLGIPSGKGSVPVKWIQLSANTLLAMSSAFFAVTPPATADRHWHSAVFAHATGQSEAATKLTEAAIKAKPEYAEQRKLLSDRP